MTLLDILQPRPAPEPKGARLVTFQPDQTERKVAGRLLQAQSQRPTQRKRWAQRRRP